MKNPLGTCTVRAATASVPTTADAPSGFPAPAISATPAPVSTAALAAAWSLGCLKPIEPNHRAVPSRVRPCRTPWAIMVAPIAVRRPRRATSIPFTILCLHLSRVARGRGPPPTIARRRPALAGTSPCLLQTGEVLRAEPGVSPDELGALRGRRRYRLISVTGGPPAG